MKNRWFWLPLGLGACLILVSFLNKSQQKEFYSHQDESLEAEGTLEPRSSNQEDLSVSATITAKDSRKDYFKTSVAEQRLEMESEDRISTDSKATDRRQRVEEWKEILTDLDPIEQKELRALASQIDKVLMDTNVESISEDIGDGSDFASEDEYDEAMSDALTMMVTKAIFSSLPRDDFRAC